MRFCRAASTAGFRSAGRQRAMEDALTLSKLSLDLHKRGLLRLSENLLSSIGHLTQTAMALSVNDMRLFRLEITLFSVRAKGAGAEPRQRISCCRPHPTAAWFSRWWPGTTMSAWRAGPDGRLLVRCTVLDKDPPRHRAAGTVSGARGPSAISAAVCRTPAGRIARVPTALADQIQFRPPACPWSCCWVCSPPPGPRYSPRATLVQ